MLVTLTSGMKILFTTYLILQLFMLHDLDAASESQVTWIVVYKGWYNESLANLSAHYWTVRDDVSANSDSRIECPLDLMSHNPNSQRSTFNITLICTTKIDVFAVDRANNRLHTAVNGGMHVRATGIFLTSSLPLYYNYIVFDPDLLTSEEVIIISVTVSVSALFFILAMLIIFKVQQKFRQGVAPSNEDTDTESEVYSIDRSLEYRQRDANRQNQRRQTLAEITPRYGANTKEITEWQPADFYQIEQKSNELLEFRAKRRVYQLLPDKCFSKLFLFNVDINGSLQKLRCEMQLKLRRKVGSNMFLFLNEDLKAISPQAECSYVIFTVYKTQTVLIRLLFAEDLEKNGWMLCPCGNIGKQSCNCQQQHYCSRFCQQKHPHTHMCNVVRPPKLEG